MMEAAQPEDLGLSSSRLVRVTEWLNAQIKRQRLAGASVLIARRGAVGFFEAAGLADLESQQPFTRDTIVRVYSMTKPVAAI